MNKLNKIVIIKKGKHKDKVGKIKKVDSCNNKIVYEVVFSDGKYCDFEENEIMFI
jgi:ribosomal protein L24